MPDQRSTPGRHNSPHEGTFWWRTLPNGKRVFAGRAEVDRKAINASLTLQPGRSPRELERRVRALIRERVAVATAPAPADLPRGREFARINDPVFRRWVHQRDAGRCGICGEPVTLDAMHVDHIRPRIDGGSDHVANFRISHPACNLRRGLERRRAIRA